MNIDQDKCTQVLQAPYASIKSYQERLTCADWDTTTIHRIVIFISETGHIKVCVDAEDRTRKDLASKTVIN